METDDTKQTEDNALKAEGDSVQTVVMEPNKQKEFIAENVWRDGVCTRSGSEVKNLIATGRDEIDRQFLAIFSDYTEHWYYADGRHCGLVIDLQLLHLA